MQNRDFEVGDIVQHFKRETLENPLPYEYIYEILGFATHTETGEILVLYRAYNPPRRLHFKVWVRPYDTFISEVDREKYPNVKQKYRFKKIGEC